MIDADKVVKVIGLKKVFRDFWHRPKVEAVRGISFEVRRGEVFGLLGPNGSGKSTTIKMLLGLLNSDEGIIKVFGEIPGSDFVKHHLGYLAEETVLFPELSAFETLVYLG
ncbi:MAG: ATP-binding cassette domain-containing protein [Lentisphaeria bacterium]